jgi:hypothetical protein
VLELRAELAGCEREIDRLKRASADADAWVAERFTFLASCYEYGAARAAQAARVVRRSPSIVPAGAVKEVHRA